MGIFLNRSETTLGTTTDYFVLDATAHTAKLYLNSVLVQEW